MPHHNNYNKYYTVEDINSDFYIKDGYYEKLSKEEIALDLVSLKNWINYIIDYLKSKGEGKE